MQETILQSIGKTPLVRLRRLAEGLQAKVYVKLESLNPGGSVKDRVAVAMINEADGSRSDGLRMNVFPQASATGNIHIGTITGKLKGVIPATTPSG